MADLTDWRLHWYLRWLFEERIKWIFGDYCQRLQLHREAIRLMRFKTPVLTPIA